MMLLRSLAMFTVGVSMLVACGGRAESGPAAGGSGGTAAGGSGATAGTNDGGPAGTGGVAADSGADTGTPDAKPPPSGQHILFEVSYENYAWQPSLNGVFITDDGSVYSYDYFAGDAGAQPPAVVFPATEQEIRSRYGANPKKTGSVALDELYAHFAEVEPAASGVLLRQYLCADAGDRSSIGYLYDPATSRYTQVVLGMDGDQAGLNTSPQAADLVKWLSKYSSSPVGGSCTFVSHECSGATCGSKQPSCPNNQLASVENGCWSKCVNADQCLAVSDCSECPGGMVCATGKDGSKHCLMSNCQSSDACSCPFTPPCAGGSAFCTTTGSLRVRCGK
jgi:hypothetical protein